LEQVRQVLKVQLDVLPPADASDGRYESDRGVRADHSVTPSTRSRPCSADGLRTVSTGVGHYLRANTEARKSSNSAEPSPQGGQGGSGSGGTGRALGKPICRADF